MEVRRTGSTIVQALEAASTISGLGSVIRDFARNHSFDHFSFGMLIPNSAIKPTYFLITGWPPGWRKVYEERQFFQVDPVIRHCLKSLHVLFWDEVSQRDLNVQQFFETARAAGLVDGVTCPFAGRRGERGFFSLVSRSALELDSVERQELAKTMHWFVAHLYEAVVRVALTPSAERTRGRARVASSQPRQEGLTEREKEVLLYFAEGLTVSNIAERLNVSDSTVWYHARTAGEKMGVVGGRERVLAAATTSGAMELTEFGIRSGLSRPEPKVYEV